MRLPCVRLRRTFAITATSTLLACGGGGSGGDVPVTPGSIEVSLSTTAVSVAQSATPVSVTVTVSRTNFSGDVLLTVENAGANVGTVFSPSTLAAGQTQSTLTLTVSATAAAGPLTLTVRARGVNVADKTAALALTITPAAGYSLVVPATMSLQPGQSGTANVALARIGYTGAVTLSAEGLPGGASGAFSPNPVAANASVLTVSTGTAVPGTYTIVVRGTAPGLPDGVAAFTLTIATPSYTLSLGGSGVSLYQATTTAVVATVVRASFAGAIAFAATGLPTGATMNAFPAAATGNVAVLTVNAGSAAPGTYSITVRASADGLAERTASFSLTVVAAPASAGVTYRVCTQGPPKWVGYQSAGVWTALPASVGGDYHFDLAGVGAFAYVVANGGDGASFGYSSAVIYGSAADLNALGRGACTAAGTKSVSGTVAGLGVSDNAGISLGTASTSATATPGTFTISGIGDGPHDLIATRNVASGPTAVAARVIARRALDPANGAVLPVLDFGSAEAFTPLAHTLTVAGPGSADEIAGGTFLTTNGSSAFLFSSVVSATGTAATRGVPDANLSPGDLHSIFADALDDDGTERAVFGYFTLAANRTLTLPPRLASPSLAQAGGSARPRFAAFMPYQSAYGLLLLAEYGQQSSASFAPSDRLVDVVVTGGYYPVPPEQWAGIMPDLTGNASYDAAWGLASAPTNVYLEVDGGSPLGTPRGEGLMLTFAATGGSVTPSAAGAAIARFGAPAGARSSSVLRAPHAASIRRPIMRR